MFRGSSQHTCDPKGRLIIPSRFQKALEEDRRKNGVPEKADPEKGDEADLVITAGFDRFLYVYTVKEWDRVVERLMNSRNTYSSKIKRHLLGNSQDCPCDKQGRILIPKNLRMYAGIQKDVTLMGMVDHFEIWSQSNFEMENQKVAEISNSSEFMNELADLGL
jgi:MraZ protein